jgi:hypothetical protein
MRAADSVARERTPNVGADPYLPPCGPSADSYSQMSPVNTSDSDQAQRLQEVGAECKSRLRVVRAVCGYGRTGERDKSVTPTRCVPRRPESSEPLCSPAATGARHRTSLYAGARRHPDAGQSTPSAGCSARVWWFRAVGRSASSGRLRWWRPRVVLECHSWSVRSQIRCRGLPIAGSGSRGNNQRKPAGGNRPQRRAVHRPVLPLLVLPAGPRLLGTRRPRQWERRGWRAHPGAQVGDASAMEYRGEQQGHRHGDGDHDQGRARWPPAPWQPAEAGGKSPARRARAEQRTLVRCREFLPGGPGRAVPR